MALYTITLSDYLKNGGLLPSIFEEIEGFTDLFVGEYFDNEIGFETTELFYLKLQQKAKLVIPFYKDKIQKINNKISELETINKKFTTKNGNQKSKTTTLPIVNTSSADISPNQIIENDEVINESSESGFNVNDNVKLLETYKEKLDNYNQILLLEFKSLFMLVY